MKGNTLTLNSFNDTGRSTPISRDRRRFLGGIAASCAGLAGTAIASSNPLPPSPAAAQAALHEPQPPCRRSKVLASDEATVFETSVGKIRGFKRNGIYIFKGVPYGASTSGANRFMPPASPEPWSGIRNSLQYGRVCPSQDSAYFDTDGKNLAIRTKMHSYSIVVQLPLYRVRIAYASDGYLNLQQLGGEEFASSANVGLLDLVAVLAWVRENVATIGGDPGCVTIFGQTGGGGNVLALMAMPAAKGLFHRAIVQSGPFLKSLSPAYSDQLAELILAELDLSKSRVRELQSVPVDRLSGAAAEAMKKMPSHQSTIRRVYGESNWGPDSRWPHTSSSPI
jgi:para-nitrobenzyl esterase